LVATPFPLCCVAPVKFISKVDKSTNELGGHDTITFWPLVAVVCPDKGVIFKVCFETPIICFTRYNIPDGIAGGTES
jgi:hypothetical protein